MDSMVPPLAVPDILPNRVVTDAAFLQGAQVTEQSCMTWLGHGICQLLKPVES